MITRRALIGTGVVAGAAPLAWTGEAFAARQRDGASLRSVLEVELLLVFAYEHVLASGTLSGRTQRSLRPLLAQERVHVALLSGELPDLGEVPPPEPASVGAADKELAARHGSGSLAQLRTETDSLQLLFQLEQIAEGAYYRGLHTLSDPRVIRLAAGIFAVEAQHATFVSGLLHPGDLGRAIPGAFVEGKR